MKTQRMPPPIVMAQLPAGGKRPALPDNIVGKVERIPLSLIDDNPIPARTAYPAALVAARAKHILASGLLEPVKLRRGTAGRYFLIDGKTRVEAYRQHDIDDAIDAIIMDVDVITAAVLGHAANHERDNGADIDEALFLDALMKQTGESQNAIAKRLGMSQTKVNQLMAFFRLPEAVRNLIVQSDNPAAMSYSHLALLTPYLETLKHKLHGLVEGVLLRGWTRGQLREAIDVALQVKPAGKEELRQYGKVKLAINRRGVRLEGLDDGQKAELLAHIDQWLKQAR